MYVCVYIYTCTYIRYNHGTYVLAVFSSPKELSKFKLLFKGPKLKCPPCLDLMIYF